MLFRSGLEPPPHIRPGLGGLHCLPCQPLHIWSPRTPQHPPQPPAPEGRARPAPLTWALTLGFQLWSPGASWLPQLRHPPVTCPGSAARGAGLAWPRLGGCGGVQTAKGRANDDCQANEISWRVVGGAEDGEGGVQLVEGPRPSPGRVGAGVWGYSGAQCPAPPLPPRTQPWREEGWAASLASPSPGREQNIRPTGLEQSCED